MEQYLWEKRVVLVFSPDFTNDAFMTHLQEYEKNQAAFRARDMAQWFIVDQSVVVIDGEPQVQFGTPPFYEYFGVSSGEFAVIILGKDGEEKVRQNTPMPLSELSAFIDAMPMAQREAGTAQ